jgi:hypothetical protein
MITWHSIILIWLMILVVNIFILALLSLLIFPKHIFDFEGGKRGLKVSIILLFTDLIFGLLFLYIYDPTIGSKLPSMFLIGIIILAILYLTQIYQFKLSKKAVNKLQKTK